MGSVLSLALSPELQPERTVILPQDILNLLLFYLHSLVSFSQVNKYYRSMILDPEFKKLRYKINPNAKDSVTDYQTNLIIDKLETDFKLTQHKHKYDYQDNSIFIELKSSYSKIYQRFGLTEDELNDYFKYNNDRIKHVVGGLATLQISFHGPKSLRQFTCQIDNGHGCYSSGGEKMTREKLYDCLYWIVFRNILMSYHPVDNRWYTADEISKKKPVVTNSIIENYQKYKVALKQ